MRIQRKSTQHAMVGGVIRYDRGTDGVSAEEIECLNVGETQCRQTRAAAAA